ncbi:2-amino-4-hydroxy-6-hydroxymethyldihydropteridine diphosphokinase [Salininema proteolyticum]|uniref:2-amino-4-hydroxy-6-hydroxymethyldihydropteridine diphosphokinase n=1 Tax=Salininema proteolyticum TaxID=1607685 RepID=A0ABV8U311_9ACTN
MSVRLLLSLGANLGEREETLRWALERLRPSEVSSFYYTPPWGDPDQPDYVNVSAFVEREGWGVEDWFAHTRDLEAEGGRVRDPERRFGPRTLDIDLIAAWEDGEPVTSDDPRLTLPHPRARLRVFVLAPWLEMRGDAELPGYGSVERLLASDELAADRKTMRKGPAAPPSA